MILLPILGIYFAIGLVLVFIGPAAHHRRRERLALEFFDQPPRWKLLALSTAIAVGIIALWPVLTISAARIESGSRRKLLATETDPTVERLKLLDEPFDPSPELQHRISEVQAQYPESLLPFEAYREIETKLPWTDRWHFGKRLSELGYAITGFATDSEGQDIPVAIRVLEIIGTPFVLTKRQGGANHFDASSFQATPTDSDEVWGFSSCQESWKHLAGRGGLALVRHGTVIDALVTIMN